MVKNKKGGSGHKKLGRKFVKADFVKRKLRVPKSEDEIFAKVVRVNGGSVFEVLCNDLKERQMIVRKKFKGRNKRDNNISINTMVLVGLRTWEVLNDKKKPKVDLLEVYSSNNKNDLLKLKTLNNKIIPDDWVIDQDDLFEFSNDVNSMNNNEHKIMEEELNKKLETLNENKQNDDELEVNWDDI